MQESKYDHGSQVTGSNLQEGHSHTVIETSTHTTEDPKYRFKILCEPILDLFIADWLSQQNHEEDKNSEIPGITTNIDAVNKATGIHECMSVHDIQQATLQDEHLQQLKNYIIQG